MSHDSATNRKLAAIMIADVAGFSRLMERDESLTFTRLRYLREDVTFPKIEEYGGRVIKTTGDGFMAEFSSAIAAVRCGIGIQRSVSELEAGQADSVRIHFRIGLNVGDIIIDGEDVAGDGVNIAARLEALSPLDGLCVSSSVHEQIRDDVGVAFVDMGEQSLKNISRSIRTYALYVGTAMPETAQPAPQPALGPAPSLDHLVQIDTDFDAVLGAGGGAAQEAAAISAGAVGKAQLDAAQTALRLAEELASAEAKRGEDERRRKDEQEQMRQRADKLAREQEVALMRARTDAQNVATERHFTEMGKELEAERAAAKLEPAPESHQGARKRDADVARARAVEEARASVRAAAALHRKEAIGASEIAPHVHRPPLMWKTPVALGVFLTLLIALVLVHVVPFDGQIPQFEKLAGAYLQQPVKIKALHLSLLPRPHWRLDDVAVGNDGRLTVASINAVAELGSMLSERKVFKSIELVSPVLSEQGLGSLLFGKAQGQDMKVASIIVRNGKLGSKAIVLPVLDATIAMGEGGAWQKIALATADKKTSLLLESKGEGAQIEVETNAFNLPFSPAFILENFGAKGVISRNELSLSEFKGAIYGGYISGRASLKWGADWGLGGEISVRAIDPGRIAPALLEQGKLEGKSAFTMRAKSYDELFAAPRMEGTFAVQKGSLLGVDLARLLQGGNIGGKTAFAELAGSFVFEEGRTQLRQVHLRSGPMSASGNADADASKNISGRFSVELRSPVAQAHADFAASGTLGEPRFNR